MIAGVKPPYTLLAALLCNPEETNISHRIESLYYSPLRPPWSMFNFRV
jgi:hypothetical protein